MKIYKLRDYYFKKGQMEAEKRLLSIISLHEKNLKILENSFKLDVKNIERSYLERERHFRKEEKILNLLKEKYSQKKDTLSEIINECETILNILQEETRQEKIIKNVKTNYLKASLDFLEKKADKI